MAIRITKEIKGQASLVAWVRRRAQHHLLSLTKCRVPGAAALIRADLSILLTGDKQIHKLNKQWRQKDKPTDVLSFPQHSVEELKKIPSQAPWELGDVVISLEKVREQAKEKGHSYRKELEILLVHGIVHLLGYDHEVSEKEAKRMERLEKKIFPR